MPILLFCVFFLATYKTKQKSLGKGQPGVPQGGTKTRSKRLPVPGGAHPSTGASSKPLQLQGSSAPTGHTPPAAAAPG